MTMLAHSLKQILDLVPEALPMVKKASIEAEMPLDSKDSTIATALQLKYFEKIAYHPVDVMDIERINRAVNAYGVNQQVEYLSEQMIKAAEENAIYASENSKEAYLTKEAGFDLQNTTIAQRVTIAQDLYKQAQALGVTPSDDVLLYSGHCHLNKEAAVQSLAMRYYKTQNKDFVKVARAIVEGEKDCRLGDADSLVKLASFVTQMDEGSHLQVKGFNFFKEAFFLKEAAYKSSMMIKLAGKNVPYESFERVGQGRISQYIGADVGSEMEKGAAHFKSVVETLPLTTCHG